MFKDMLRDMSQHMAPRTHPDTLATGVDCLHYTKNPPRHTGYRGGLLTLAIVSTLLYFVADLYFTHTEDL